MYHLKMFSLRKLVVTIPRPQVRLLGTSAAEVLKPKDLDACKKEMDKFNNSVSIEGAQGQLKNLSYQDSTKALQDAIDYSVHGPSVQGIQGGHDDLIDVLQNEQCSTRSLQYENVDAFNCSGNLNLHGCMQSNVPEPFSTTHEQYESPCNLPGNGRLLMQKYINGAVSLSHPNRQFHTGKQQYSVAQTLLSDDAPDPQGIQGDDCTLDLWMETCLRFNLPNCQEQLANIQEGRKTLSEVFAEQEAVLRQIAENYKSKKRETTSNTEIEDLNYHPSPQGIQGDDCVRYQLWLENCQRFSFGECKDQLSGVRSGRKTLAQVLAEQDAQIRNAVTNFYQKRSYSTSSNPQDSEVGRDQNSQSNPVKLSNKDRLKRAVKEYGSTVIVFHVGISLISLGSFYLAVSRYFVMIWFNFNYLNNDICVSLSILQS